MTSRHREAKAGKRNRLNNIPIALRKIAQWVCSDSNGRPINPRTGTFAKSNDAATWGTFEEAARACATFGHEHVAFALTKHDPFCIVDLDDKPSRPASEEQRALFD